MSNYLKKYEDDYNKNKISLSQLQTYRREYDRLSDEEKEKLDYPNGKPIDTHTTTKPTESLGMTESLSVDERILQTLERIEENTTTTNGHLMFYTVLFIIGIVLWIFSLITLSSRY